MYLCFSFHTVLVLEHSSKNLIYVAILPFDSVCNLERLKLHVAASGDIIKRVNNEEIYRIE